MAKYNSPIQLMLSQQGKGGCYLERKYRCRGKAVLLIVGLVSFLLAEIELQFASEILCPFVIHLK